jgi:hypothetical protein
MSWRIPVGRRSPTASVAQWGTPQEQAACRPDVLKHCTPLIDPNSPKTFGILACLQANREKISQACRGVLESHGV